MRPLSRLSPASSTPSTVSFSTQPPRPSTIPIFTPSPSPPITIPIITSHPTSTLRDVSYDNRYDDDFLLNRGNDSDMRYSGYGMSTVSYGGLPDFDNNNYNNMGYSNGGHGMSTGNYGGFQLTTPWDHNKLRDFGPMAKQAREDPPPLNGTNHNIWGILPGGATAPPDISTEFLVRWNDEKRISRPLVGPGVSGPQRPRATGSGKLGAMRSNTRGLVGRGSHERNSEDERKATPYVAGVPLDLNLDGTLLLRLSDDSRETVWRLLNAILSQKSAYKALLQSRGQKAQVTIDILRKSLDSEGIPEKLKPPTLSAMIRLCASSGVYPKCFELRGVYHDTTPVASGSFGEIWKGYLGPQVVSLKVARVYAGSDVEDIIRSYSAEAILWSQLNHPNVLPFYGIYYLDGRLGRVGLVSPWMHNGNVNEYLKANPEAPRMSLVHDIFAGLGYLHERSIVHGDLKGANILISSNGSACLADFGLSSIVHAEVLRWTSLKTTTKTGGTARWEAPELMDELEDGTSPRPTFLSDVYSTASVMYEVLTGQVPYYEFPRDTTVMMRVIKGIKPSKPTSSLVLELSDEVWQVMEGCWNQEPSSRPTVTQVARQLREIPEHELTTRRATAHHSRKRESNVENRTLHPRVFRDAIRGDHLTFSQTEIDLLRGYWS